MDEQIYYTITTGIIGQDGNQYEDDYVDSSTDFEGQAKLYIDMELSKLREAAELEGDLEDGEVVYKKLTAEKQDEDGYILDAVELDYEDESAPHDPPLTCAADLGDVVSLIALLQ